MCTHEQRKVRGRVNYFISSFCTGLASKIPKINEIYKICMYIYVTCILQIVCDDCRHQKNMHFWTKQNEKQQPFILLSAQTFIFTLIWSRICWFICNEEVTAVVGSSFFSHLQTFNFNRRKFLIKRFFYNLNENSVNFRQCSTFLIVHNFN